VLIIFMFVFIHQGHNLGHAHSGKGGVTYADPTCNMGNQGASAALVLAVDVVCVIFYLFFHLFCFAYIPFPLAFVLASFLVPGSWSDTGSVFCFNPAKTWYNGWYSSDHAEVDPSSSPYDGELVGINAVRDGTILSGQDVVLKIATSGETTLFVMFNRQIGANSGVPGDGDKVLITSQSSSSATSAWEAGLSSGQTHTVSGWSNKGTLNIKVCSIDLSSHGKAHILVYADGQSTPTCDGTPPPPTSAAPVQSPTASPIAAPTPPPTDSPTIDTNCGSDEWRMAVVLTTDGWPSETSWVINDTAGNAIASKAIGSYVARYTTHQDYACINKSKCYTFTINDTWGDGLLGDAGYAVEVYDRGGVAVDVVASGSDFGFVGECPTISGNI